MNNINTNKLTVTLLSLEQIYGDKRLKIFDKFGIKAELNDFAILCGAYVANGLEHNLGVYWTNEADGNDDTYAVFPNGKSRPLYVCSRRAGIRPVLTYSSILNASNIIKDFGDGILEVEFFEYPQMSVSVEMQNILENLYNNNRLLATGRCYTTDLSKYTSYNEGFKKNEYIEYEYDKERYVRVKANSCFNGMEFVLSNKEKYADDDYVWVKVSPIKWYVDKEADVAVSKNLLLSGLQFNEEKKYKGDFENVTLCYFLNTYFIQEIMGHEYEDVNAINQGDTFRSGLDNLNKTIKNIYRKVRKR